jgi:uncharacterized membrane protein YfbV (UPF0208 family)
MCSSPFAIKSTFKNRNIIKQHIRFLAVTAVLGITIFATLIYFAGQTTSAVNLSLIAISIPLYIWWGYKNDWYSNNHIGSFNTTKGSLQSLLHIRLQPVIY